MIGRNIKHYRIERLLGDGGMGSVYGGVDLQVGRRVAVKVIHSHLRHSPDLWCRFHDEANIQARLIHPNIVSVYDFDPQAGAIIMEYVPGRGLDEMISRETGPIPEARCLALFRQILAGVGHAHDFRDPQVPHGVIHRDLKPSNFLVWSDGGPERIKVTDFGIAKIFGDARRRPSTGHQVGTVYYMSPEQVLANKNVSPQSDIYSLGVTLYEMATGRIPFDADSNLAVMDLIVAHKFERPSRLYPGVSPALEAIIMKAMERKPDRRFASCAEMLEACSYPVQGTGPRRAMAMPPPSPLPTPAPAATPAPAKPCLASGPHSPVPAAPTDGSADRILAALSLEPRRLLLPASMFFIWMSLAAVVGSLAPLGYQALPITMTLLGLMAVMLSFLSVDLSTTPRFIPRGPLLIIHLVLVWIAAPVVLYLVMLALDGWRAGLAVELYLTRQVPFMMMWAVVLRREEDSVAALVILHSLAQLVFCPLGLASLQHLGARGLGPASIADHEIMIVSQVLIYLLAPLGLLSIIRLAVGASRGRDWLSTVVRPRLEFPRRLLFLVLVFMIAQDRALDPAGWPMMAGLAAAGLAVFLLSFAVLKSNRIGPLKVTPFSLPAAALNQDPVSMTVFSLYSRIWDLANSRLPPHLKRNK